MNKIHAMYFGYAGGLVSALIMLVLGVLGNLGIYTGAVAMMQEWHMFFSLSLLGIIGGIIESLIISFVIFYLLAVTYNWLLTKNSHHE